jgi:hypothetical protein
MNFSKQSFDDSRLANQQSDKTSDYIKVKNNYIDKVDKNDINYLSSKIIKIGVVMPIEERLL